LVPEHPCCTPCFAITPWEGERGLRMSEGLVEC
jgi:hypothetical protein